MNQLLKTLNDAQKEAVLTTSGPVLIIAGAGAGKTKTITHRIGYLIETGVPGEKILAITFTNKAAKEMRERVFRLLNKPIPFGYQRKSTLGAPWISTFHSLGIAILREHGDRIGISKSATILDQDDAKKIVKDALKAQGVDSKTEDPGNILSRISRHKGNMGTFDTIASTVRDERKGQLLARTMQIYEQTLRKTNALDFDDLLEKTVRLLDTHPDIRSYYNNRWTHVHIDEYQDTNQVQYTLSKLLVGNEHNICVVGDGDQSIYSWRGASLSNILHFEEDYPEAKVILLEQNYRSTKNILAAANDVVVHNTLRKEKTLFTENDSGEKLKLIQGFDETDEARKIAHHIAGLTGGGISPKHIAILYRTNVQSRVLEEAMLYSGIPYQVLGTRFYERKEVKDVLAYIRTAINRENTVDMSRIINVPARGIGEKTLDKILSENTTSLSPAIQAKIRSFYNVLDAIASAALVQKPSELVLFTIKETGLERFYKEGDEEDAERLGNMYELVTIAKRYDGEEEDGLQHFLEDIALEGEQDKMHDGNAVRLMTVHASKGLEFDYVFIAGLEQDLFPSTKMRENETLESKEEERRLFYVAITRGAKRVFLTYAAMRTMFGNRAYTNPSEFIQDIRPELIESDTPKHDPNEKKRKISLLDDPFEEDSFFW